MQITSHTAPNELIEELDAGMMVAVPLYMIPELQPFDMTLVLKAITTNPGALEKAGEG